MRMFRLRYVLADVLTCTRKQPGKPLAALKSPLHFHRPSTNLHFQFIFCTCSCSIWGIFFFLTYPTKDGHTKNLAGVVLKAQVSLWISGDKPSDVCQDHSYSFHAVDHWPAYLCVSLIHLHLSSLFLFPSNVQQAYSKNSQYFLSLFLLSLSLKVIWLFLLDFFACPLCLQHLPSTVDIITCLPRRDR